MASRLPASLRLATQRLRRAASEKPRLLYRPPPWAVRPTDSGPGPWNDESKRICVLTANRCGKTWMAIHKLVNEALSRPKTRWRIVGPDSKTSNTVHGPILWEAIQDQVVDDCSFKFGRGFNRANTAVLKNGSTIQLLNYKMDPQAHAGASLHGVVLDESPIPAIFREAEKRVFDTNGWVLVVLTALDRPLGWLKKTVMEGVKQGLWSFYQVGLSHENCPWYSEDKILAEVRRASLSPWSYAQTIEGAWEGVAADRYYVGWDPDRNRVPLTQAHTVGWPFAGTKVSVALAVDHGEGAGNSVWVLFGYQAKASRGGVQLAIRVLGEFATKTRGSVAAEAKGVQAMLADVGLTLADVDIGVGDTNTAGKSEGAKFLNEQFEQEFAKLLGRHPDNPRFRIQPVRKGADSVTGSVAQVNQLLDEKVEGVPALQVHESCELVQNALAYWAGGKYDPFRHAADALRYGVTTIQEEAGWLPVRIVAG